MNLESIHKRDRKYSYAKRKEYSAKPRIYVSLRESVVENMIYRRSRPFTEYRKLMPQILRLMGLPPETKVFWSQKAGCSCGCSPGFIVQHHSHWDAWANVYGSDAQVSADPERQALAQSRARQIA